MPHFHIKIIQNLLIQIHEQNNHFSLLQFSSSSSYSLSLHVIPQCFRDVGRFNNYTEIYEGRATINEPQSMPGCPSCGLTRPIRKLSFYERRAKFRIHV